MIFLDEETTGKLHESHRIIELAMRLVDFDTQEEIKEITWRFNPLRNIDKAAFDVHGISLDDLKSKPTIDKFLPDIAKILKQSALVVSHNGESFDVPFLKMEFERNGVEFPDFKHFDTMLNGTFATDLGKSPSLEELCWSLDVDYDPEKAHGGAYDTAVLRDCFFTGVNRGWYNPEMDRYK